MVEVVGGGGCGWWRSWVVEVVGGGGMVLRLCSHNLVASMALAISITYVCVC